MDPANVRVWRVALHTGSHHGEGLLTPEEIQRAASFKVPLARERFVQCRGALRFVLGSLLGMPPQAVRLARGAGGKPRLMDMTRPAFNVSHCSSAALIAVSAEADVGVDIEEEQWLSQVDGMAGQVFSLEEQQVLREQRDPSLTFLRGWTRKEAVVKAVGVGLAMDLREVSVSLGAQAVLGRTPFEPGEWTLADISVRGYVAAVAVRAAAAKMSIRTFEL